MMAIQGRAGTTILTWMFAMFMMFISGCAAPVANNSSGPLARPAAPIKAVQSPDTVRETKLRKSLLDHYQSWKGVSYRYGGLNKHGIDCSGFVHLTYRNVLGIKLPRSTKLLARSGRVTTKDHLTTGDLVIFHTDRHSLHVGIYIGDNRFMHASKSSGVMLSNLDAPYWSEHYWKSIRILQ
ncbi:MAG: NlpC/P60 family protein [Mariprofundaceae bacterium]